MLKAKTEKLNNLLAGQGMSVWAVWKAVSAPEWAYKEFIHARNNTGTLSANQRERRLQQFADALGVDISEISEEEDGKAA